MSLSYTQLKPVRVIDPITDVQSVRDYAILAGGNQVSWKAYTSTAIAPSSIQFSCPPPSTGVIIDRKQYFTLPIRLLMSGTITTTSGGFTPTTSLLNAGYDAPRNFPFSSSLDTLQVSINNDSVAINMSDIIQALTHYNIDNKLKSKDYSMTPCYPDQSFNYADLHGSIRSPLAFYADGLDGVQNQRGAFPFTVVSNATVTPSTGGTAATAVVDMLVCEPLFLSPFYWGCNDAEGFYNVGSMDFNMTFLTGAGNRMWSHDAITPVATGGGASVTSVINSISVQFNAFSSPSFSYNISQPQLLFKYITPNLLMKGLGPNTPLTYAYFDILRYPTVLTNTISYASGPQIQSSNNIQLSQIPRRMYLYGRPANSVLQSRCDITDCYLAITNVNIQWANQSTILSSATQQQLYLLNTKNHSDQSWLQWSGQLTNNSSFPPSAGNASFGTEGGPICFEFGTDIQLNPDEAPGLRGQYQIQVNATFQNMNASGAWDTLPMTMYLVFVMEGTFCITSQNSAVHFLGAISKTDILDAQSQTGVSYRDIEEVNGGNFLSGLRDFGSKINEFLKKSKIGSNLLNLVPVLGPALSKSAANLGYGEGVAISSGGRRMSKAQLKKSLMSR